MDRYRIPRDIIEKLPTPCYVVSLAALEDNLAVLDSVQKRTGVKILLALKGFSMFSTFHLIKQYLAGTSASSLNEVRLGKEEFGKETHIVCPAFRDDEFDNIIKYADHVVFNSFRQWQKFRPMIENAGKKIEVGLRVNPLYSEVEIEIYNPCSASSRLGIRPEKFQGQNLDGIDGLHFHAMCEQNSDTLVRVLENFEKHFSHLIPQMKWINFGGGHHISRADYNVDLLCDTINGFRKRYNNVPVYLEPGEAIALNTGLLVSRVLDVISGDINLAILDTSAAAHMPDMLEMPYRPMIIDSGKAGEKKHTYKLGGPTCLAGDVVGDYSFDEPLKEGDLLCFTDMAHYTMVKNNTFNGINLPSIAIYDNKKAQLQIVRRFGYEDFKTRLS